MKLSVLDLIPTRTGQSTDQALQASAALAREADRLGFTRYWVAEHHNMPAVASTVPAVLIPFLAQGTDQIRFGSGGVMLPNHAAFAVAEQFALLAAMLPGRVDLGIGRAPGSDPLTAAVLRGGSPGAAVDSFEQDLRLVTELLGAGDTPVGEPVPITVGGRPYELRATPKAETGVEVWLLGSSGFSADLAARMGLPYAFAHHFGAPGLAAALGNYRQRFTASAKLSEPRSLVPVNVVVARDQDEVERRAVPHLVQMARLRTGATLSPQLTVQEAQRYEWSEAEMSVADSSRGNWFIGTPEVVADQLRAFAEQHQVDELMVSAVAGASEDDPLAESPARVETLQLLAAELL